MADNFGEIAERSGLRKRQKAEGRQRGGSTVRLNSMAKLGGVTVAGWGCRSCVPQRMGCDDVGPRLCDRTHLRVLLRTLQQARHGRTSETKQPQAPVRSGEQCCCGQPTKLRQHLLSKQCARCPAGVARDDLQCRGVFRWAQAVQAHPPQAQVSTSGWLRWQAAHTR